MDSFDGADSFDEKSPNDANLSGNDIIPLTVPPYDMSEKHVSNIQGMCQTLTF